MTYGVWAPVNMLKVNFWCSIMMRFTIFDVPSRYVSLLDESSIFSPNYVIEGFFEANDLSVSINLFSFISQRFQLVPCLYKMSSSADDAVVLYRIISSLRRANQQNLGIIYCWYTKVLPYRSYLQASSEIYNVVDVSSR